MATKLKELENELSNLIKQIQKNNTESANARAYLGSTDYIMSKFTEALVNGVDITTLKEEYKEQLTLRPLKRDRINEIKVENKTLMERVTEIREILKNSK